MCDVSHHSSISLSESELAANTVKFAMCSWWLIRAQYSGSPHDPVCPVAAAQDSALLCGRLHLLCRPRCEGTPKDIILAQHSKNTVLKLTEMYFLN